MKNKVILIGTNHHNILGLVRSFGVNGIHPDGIIIGDDAARSFVRKSKYWAKTWVLSSEDELIQFMIENYENEEGKPVVIPCSDSAAAIIDLNYNLLMAKYILPSINGEQGKIVKLMDKQQQMEFAKKYKIPMAESFVIETDNVIFPQSISYPCIIKPVSSVEGKKSDIKKCENEEEAKKYIEKLKNKGYSRILVQEFVNFEYEVGFIGASCKKSAYLINRKKRIWPQIGGSNSFVKKNNNIEVEKFCLNILDILRKIGYNGMFDVEIMYTPNAIYLNEINWRNSGNSFFCLGSDVHYAVVWYYIITNKKIPYNFKFTCEDKKFYAMDESKDIRHVIAGNISLKRWIQDVKKSKCFAIWYKKDMKPTIIRYGYLIVEFIRRKGISKS